MEATYTQTPQLLTVDRQGFGFRKTDVIRFDNKPEIQQNSLGEIHDSHTLVNQEVGRSVMSGESADLHEKIRRLPVLSAHLKEILSQEALSDPFKVFPGPRGALALTISLPGSGKDCVLHCIHLLYIKRLDQQIVLRFSMAEVRISARRTWHKF